MASRIVDAGWYRRNRDESASDLRSFRCNHDGAMTCGNQRAVQVREDLLRTTDRVRPDIRQRIRDA